MQDMNAMINQKMLALVDKMNHHTNTIMRAYEAAFNTTTDQEKALLIAEIAASGLVLAEAWSGMVMLGRVGAMHGLDPSAVIDATAIEKDDNAN